MTVDRNTSRQTRIGDLGEIFTGRTPPTKRPAYFGEEFPFITPGDMHQGKYVLATERSLSSEGAALLGRIQIPANSVCVSCIGWQMGEVIMTARPSFTNQQINTIVPNSQVDASFLYYALRPRKRELLSLGSGIGVRTPILNKSAFCDLKVRVPSLPTQRRIAAILSAYDDLIENNTRRIAILEEMARRLYEEWFVRFRFPGWEKANFVGAGRDRTPAKWNWRPLFEAAEITYGCPFKSKLFNTEGNGTPIIRIRDIPAGRTKTFTTEEADAKYAVEDDDILIGMDGNFHMCRWSGGHAVLNQRVVRIRPKVGLHRYFLFLALAPVIEALENAIVGTTVAHLSDRDLKAVKLVTPPEAIASRASEALDPLWSLERVLRQENVRLRSARDLLLPRLVSGELDVSKLDIPIPKEAA